MHLKGNILRNQKVAELVKKCCSEFPEVEIDANLQPITRTVLRIRLKIVPRFRWNDRVHGKSSEAFWLWIEDPENNVIYHYEYFVMARKNVSIITSVNNLYDLHDSRVYFIFLQVYNNIEQELVMTIPLSEPLPSQYLVKIASDRWLGCETIHPLSFKNLILPECHPPHTGVLNLK